MPASYKIPQNVDLEDKIFGPFSLKQFLTLLAGGVLTFVHFSVWFTAFPGVFYLLTFLTWVIVVAFVFVRPNEQAFSKFFFSFVRFAIKPQRRIWQRIPSLGEITLRDEAAETPKVVKHQPTPEEVRSKLSRLAHIVDTRGWSDVDEDAADINARVTGGQAQPQYNIEVTDSDLPEDILEKEEASRGSDRTSAELERVLKGREAKRPRHDMRPAKGMVN